MSYHARLTRDARIRLATQRKNTTVSSLLISLFIILLLGIILFLITFRTPSEEKEPIVFTFSYQEISKEEAQEPQTKSLAKSTTETVIAAQNVTETVVTPLVKEEEPAPDTEGNPTEEFSNLPAGMRARCNPAQRAKRLAATGGSPATDEAITRALDWLTKAQNKNGSWGHSTKYRPGITGLAILAYLGRCHTPADENPDYAEAVLQGTLYLIDLAARNNGRITSDFNSHWCYDHAVATYALCESYTFSKSLGYDVPHLKSAARHAIRWIISKQGKKHHGWSYTYSSTQRTDTSINAWHIQALHAAEKTGLKIKGLSACLKKALDPIIAARQSNGGFRYVLAKHPRLKEYYPLTAPATLCLQLRTRPGHPVIKKAVRYMMEKERFRLRPNYDLYEHYYLAQVMMNDSPESWERYRSYALARLFKHQKKSGQWAKLPRNRWSIGKVYDTSMAVLIAETHYRFLPSFQRKHQEVAKE